MIIMDFPSHYEEIIPPKTESRLRLEAVKKEAFNYMPQLEGWCSFEKAGFLIDLILKNRPKKIVEIGVWGGKSLIPMARALKENGEGVIYGIDPWQNHHSVASLIEEVNLNFWSRVDHELIYLDLLYKMRLFQLENQIKIVRMTSQEAPLIEGIDLLHIDGNHSDEASYFDVTKWVPLVNSGGWIVFDDLDWLEKGVYTTGRAVEWLDANCHRFAQFTDSCTWGVWVKP